MSFENIALVVAWSIGLIVVVAVVVPSLMARKADDRAFLFEDDVCDLDGPFIDAEPV